jgi:Amt family ammonium transporter
MVLGKNDPGFIHNGPLAGLVAVCAGSDLMHPIGAWSPAWSPAACSCSCSPSPRTAGRSTTCSVCGPARPVRCLGRHCRGIFGAKALGGMGGVSLAAQLIGTLGGIVVALAGGYLVYGLLRATIGIRLDPEEEYEGADLTIHKITATPDRETHW